MSGPTRRLAAILAADVADYSRLMGEDETRTLGALRQLRGELFEPIVAAHRGNVVKRMGDGWLVEFASVVDAVNCALEIQEGLAGHEVIRLRIGIHIGDVVFEEEDIYGDGVNIAARLQEIATPGAVAVSEMALKSLDGKLAGRFADQGSHSLKNIAEPVRVYSSGGGSLNIQAAMSPKAEEQPSIAVLPFENLTADPADEYFVDGVTEDIITELSRFHDFKVIARNSVFTFKGKSLIASDAAKQLGVRYVVQGSVRKAGNRLRISAQLMAADSDTTLWAERFDRELDDIFALQDEITLAVVSAVAPRSSEAERKRASRLDNRDLGVWDTVARARYLYNLNSREAFDEGIPFLRRAIERHRENPALHILLAKWLVFAIPSGWGGSPEEDLHEAASAAREALRLDSLDADAHLARAAVLLWQRRHHDALQAAEKAIELNPNFSEAFGMSAAAFGISGQYEKSVERFTRAMNLSPLDTSQVGWYAGVALGAFFAEEYEEMARFCTESIDYNPHFPSAYRQRAVALVNLGRIEEAQADIATLLRLAPTATIAETRARVPIFAEQMDKFVAALRIAGLPEE